MFGFILREKFTILLVLILLNVIAVPFVPAVLNIGIFINITFSLAMVASVLTISKEKKKPLQASIVLLLPCLFFLWWDEFFSTQDTVAMTAAVFQALFILYMGCLILLFVLKSRQVSRDVISAALVVYLFLALFFNKLYLILELGSPGSFSTAHEVIRQDPSVLRYFSLVTLSTLGYGDVLPVTSKARTLASSQAMIGQIYLAVLIARLVGIQGGAPPEEKR